MRFLLCNKTVFVNLQKRKMKNIAFFPFLYYNITCKKNLPFKNFFYIITPYLIIYTPLGGLGSSPIKTFFFCFFINSQADFTAFSANKTMQAVLQSPEVQSEAGH